MDWRGIPAEYRNQIVTGDARELSDRIPDESIDLIFTDPVYDRIDDYRWLAQTAARVLKPGGSLLAFGDHIHQSEIFVSMGTHLTPCPFLVQWLPPPYYRLWKFKTFINYMFLFWFSNGVPKGNRWITLELGQSKQHNNDGNHKWSKFAGVIAYYVNAFSQSGDIVLDTYCGGGTVPAVCKMLGRNYVAFEIDPTTAERARERVALTQPPLFVLQPEQMEMGLT